MILKTILIVFHYFFPSIALMIVLPIFLSRPALLVGMPVSRANFCFIFVMPNARLSENDTPGISDFLAILIIETVTAIRAFKFMNFTSIAMFQSCTPAASMAYGTTFWTTMSYLRTLISCPLADKEEKTSA